MHMFVVLNQSNLFTTHKSYVELWLIDNLNTLFVFELAIKNTLAPRHKEMATKTKKHPIGKLNCISNSFCNDQIKSNN